MYDTMNLGMRVAAICLILCQQVALSIDASSSVPVKHVAIFLQARMIPDKTNHSSRSWVWQDLLKCVSNVNEAQKLAHSYDETPWVNVKKPSRFSFQIFASLPPGMGPKLKAELKELGPTHVHVNEISKNSGMDIKQFLFALRVAVRKNATVDYILKIHSKTSLDWRRQALDSLCGSPAQVLTVLNSFESKEQPIGVVVPQGLLIRTNSSLKRLYAPLRNYYSSETISPADVFNKKNVDNMKRLYYHMFKKELDPDIGNYVCNAGTMFWVKFDDFQGRRWISLLPWLRSQWTQGYVIDGGVEHAIERLFMTIPYLEGVKIAEIVPAPQPIGIYFPQYHRMPENDLIHGEGFTEWTLLKPSTVDFLAKPLPLSGGGLGYYDLTDKSIRKRQGELARLAGLSGFMYYHYWFAGNSSFKYKNPVMGKIPELMLNDGEPNLPFMFSWANEPWTSTWSGGDGRVFLPQDYGGVEEWQRHFNYLLPFFKHRNYIRVKDRPVFVIYRIGLMKEVLQPMLELWRKMAKEAGLRGLHIVYTLNNFARTDSIFDYNMDEFCDASFQFFPTLAAAFHAARGEATSKRNVHTPRRKEPMRQYWGGFAGFSNRVRRENSKSWTRLVPPQEFRESMRESFTAMGTSLPETLLQVNNPNFYFITAWNEWNEQAQLEPSDKYGFEYLSAIKANLEELPMTIVV